MGYVQGCLCFCTQLLTRVERVAKFLNVPMILVVFELVKDVRRHAEQWKQLPILRSHIVAIEPVEESEKIIRREKQMLPFFVARSARRWPSGLHQNDAWSVSGPVRSFQHFPLATLDIDLEEIDRPLGVLVAHPRQGRDGCIECSASW